MSTQLDWSGVLGQGLAEVQLAPLPVWRELSAGRSRVVGSYASEQRVYLEIAGCREVPLLAGQARILERLISGQSAKVIAIESRRSLSSVTAHAQRALARLGLACQMRDMPCSLVGLVLCALGAARPGHIDLRISAADERTLVVSLARLEHKLERLLSPCECQVLRGVVDGLSHLQIAAKRGAARRTVANQVASSYKKLSVTCRIELLRYLMLNGTPLP
ncbi:MAG: helix-turn-helix transcriptional regulator [Polyangiaceae bacterium]